jgi:hypothetical protein
MPTSVPQRCSLGYRPQLCSLFIKGFGLDPEQRTRLLVQEYG